MSKCAVIADEDPCLSAVAAHLLTSVFDTEVYKTRIGKKFEFYTTETPCFDSALAVEIIGSPIGDYRAPNDIANEDVVVLITTSRIGPHDILAKRLLENNVPVLQLGDFHPLKIDFTDFNEQAAGHSFAVALAEASVGIGNYLLNVFASSL
jgi:hypothetical protein